MAVTYVGAGTFTPAASGNITVPLPTYAAGDLLIAFVVARGSGATIDDVSGWTGKTQQNNGSNLRTRVFYRIAGASETDPTFTQSGATQNSIAGNIWSWSGVDAGTPFDVTDVIDTGSLSTTMTLTGITPVTDGAHQLFLYATQDNNTLANPVPSAYSALRSSDDWTDGNDGSMALVEISTSYSGTISLDQTAVGPDAWVGYSMALRPSGGGGGAQTITLDIATETDTSYDVTPAFSGGGTYKAAGTFASALADAVTPGLPTFGAGDFLLAWVVARGNGVVIDDVTGWTGLTQQNNGATLRSRAFWRLSDGTETAPTFTQSTGTLNSIAARIWSFEGVDGSDPLDTTEVLDTGATSPMSTTGVTTVSDNVLVAALFATEDNNTLGSVSGGTLRTADDWTDGNDGSMALVTDQQAAPGASGAVSLTQSINGPDTWLALSVPLRSSGGNTTVALSLATETDTAYDVVGQASDQTIALSLATETDVALPFVAQSNDPWGILAGRAAITRPAGAVDIVAPTDPQTVIDSHPAGTTYWFTGTFNITAPIKPKSGDSLLTNNAMIVGDAAFTSGDRTIDTAVLDGCPWGIDLKQGTGDNGVSTGVTVRGFEISDMAEQGIRVWIGARISHCIVHDCYQNGIGGGMANTAWVGTDSNYQAEVTDCILYENGCMGADVMSDLDALGNPNHIGSGNGAGGMKWGRTGTGTDLKQGGVATPSGANEGVYIERVLFQGNIGNGYWADVTSGGDYVRDCVSRDNTRKGFFILEVSVGPSTIEYCTAYNNCKWTYETADRPSSDWGISTETSLNVTIQYNIADSNGVSAVTATDYNKGIHVGYQSNRVATYGHGTDSVTVVNNNLQGGDTLTVDSGSTNVVTSNNGDLGTLYGASWFGLYVPGTTPSNDTTVGLDIATETDAALPLEVQPDTAAVAAVETGTYGAIPVIKIAQRVVHWAVDGTPVSAEWDSATMTAPGGYDLTELRIAKANLPDVGQGALVRAVTGQGHEMWVGRVVAPPKMTNDLVTLQARGPVSVLERQTERVPWQVRGADLWGERYSEPYNYGAPSKKFDLFTRANGIGWTIGQNAGAVTINTGFEGYALQTRGYPIARIAFTINKTDDDSHFSLRLRTADVFGSSATFTDEQTWGLGTANPDGTARDYTLTNPADIVELTVMADSAVTLTDTVEKFWLSNLRVNCLSASDDDLTSDVMTYLAGVCGYRLVDVHTGTVSPLPLDWTGDWPSLADYLALLEDWVWTVEGTGRARGAFGAMRFGPWGRREWRVRLGEGASENLVMLPVYNQVTTFYEKPAGVQQSETTLATDIGLKDPLRRQGVVEEWPDPVTLNDPQPNDDLAALVNTRLLQRVTRQRVQGTIRVSKVDEGTPQHIKAGDTVRVADFSPSIPAQRITGVSYNSDGTVDLTVGRDVGGPIAARATLRGRIRRR